MQRVLCEDRAISACSKAPDSKEHAKKNPHERQHATGEPRARPLRAAVRTQISADLARCAYVAAIQSTCPKHIELAVRDLAVSLGQQVFSSADAWRTASARRFRFATTDASSERSREDPLMTAAVARNVDVIRSEVARFGEDRCTSLTSALAVFVRIVDVHEGA